MYRTLALIAPTLFAAFGCAAAQPGPTRLGVITAVLEMRRSLYAQPVIIDGCSIARMVDSVTKTTGSIGSEFSNFVRGAQGSCLPRDAEVGPYVLEAYRLTRGVEFLPDIEPAEAKSFLKLLVKVENRLSRQFAYEEWALKQLSDGAFVVLGVRTSIGHD